MKLVASTSAVRRTLRRGGAGFRHGTHRQALPRRGPPGRWPCASRSATTRGSPTWSAPTMPAASCPSGSATPACSSSPAPSACTFSFNGQYSDDAPAPLEQFVIGGRTSARAYPIADALSARGYYTSLEYHADYGVAVPRPAVARTAGSGNLPRLRTRARQRPRAGDLQRCRAPGSSDCRARMHGTTPSSTSTARAVGSQKASRTTTRMTSHASDAPRFGPAQRP